jgi:hypothetical protein
MGVLKLSSCADTGIKISVTVLQGADQQMSLAVQGDGLGRPPSISTPLIRHVPLRPVQLVAIEFVLPSQSPGLAFGCGWKLIVGFRGPRRDNEQSKQQEWRQSLHEGDLQ